MGVYPDTISYRADIYDLQTSRFLYSENHAERWENQKHVQSEVLYRDATEKPFALKLINYNKIPYSPSFQLDDYRTGYQEGASYTNDSYKVYFRKNKKEALQESLLKLSSPVVTDGGLDYFLKTHIDRLNRGEVIRANFIVAHRLTYYSCRAEKVSNTSVNGKQAVLVRLEPESWIVRTLSDPIFVTYDLESKRLLVYEGNSNIEDETTTSNHKIRAVFTYFDNSKKTALK